MLEPKFETDKRCSARSSALTVLLVHNSYRQWGGEDVVVEAETKLLEQRGHRVHHFTARSDEILERGSLRQRLRLAVEAVWSASARKRMCSLLRRARPDIAHFHNTFPLISPSVYGACRELDVPVVQTLHNYRLLCPAASLARNDRPCEDCLGKVVPWPGVVHACYRDSHVQTAVASTMLAVHNVRGTWAREVDVYLALTEFGRQLHIRGGLPAARVLVKPNCLNPDPGLSASDREFFVFASRLDRSKGFETLLKAWDLLPTGMPLRILNDGPLAGRLSFGGGDPQIDFLGRVPRHEMIGMLGWAKALIFPSQWYEGLGNVNIEAFACGTPVIASRLGAIPEVIRHGETGLLFNPGDAQDLAGAVTWATEHPQEMRRMGIAARAEFEAKYTAEHVYAKLMEAYDLARAGRQ